MTRKPSCCIALAFMLSLSALPSLLSADLSDTEFDYLFRMHAEQRLPRYDWLWTKAQAYQESRFDPAAVSPAGAVGLMQIMPVTGHEQAIRTGVEGPLTSPMINVLYGTDYMARQERTWFSPRPLLERLWLMFASYNAGAGNIIVAQELAGGALLWDAISMCLVQVTGHHSKETLTYVERIRRWYGQLKAAEQ